MESRAGVLAHPGLWSSAVIAVSALGMRWWLGSARNPSRPTVPGTLGLIVPGIVTLLLVSTSFEVARAAGVLASDPTVRRAAVSIWWGLVSVGLIVAGFAARRPLARHSGLALLVLATGKACVFDLAEVPQTWRIASFVGLGLLMLGVAVGYARAAALLRGGPAPTADPSM
jgi:uncharacterized membrane protein